MRGHGFVAAARSLIEVVRMSVYTPRNAGYKPYSPETWRAWEYWATRAGCAQLLRKRDG